MKKTVSYVEKLEKAIIENPYCKLIYLIPTFQNPSGTTMSLEKRKRVIELANKYDKVILEDNPYGELRFEGEDIPTLKSLDTEDRVIYCSSFSKVLSAGMRIGFICGNKDIIQKVVVVKQVNARSHKHILSDPRGAFHRTLRTRRAYRIHTSALQKQSSSDA